MRHCPSAKHVLGPMGRKVYLPVTIYMFKPSPVENGGPRQLPPTATSPTPRRPCADAAVMPRYSGFGDTKTSLGAPDAFDVLVFGYDAFSRSQRASELLELEGHHCVTLRLKQERDTCPVCLTTFKGFPSTRRQLWDCTHHVCFECCFSMLKASPRFRAHLTEAHEALRFNGFQCPMCRALPDVTGRDERYDCLLRRFFKTLHPPLPNSARVGPIFASTVPVGDLDLVARTLIETVHRIEDSHGLRRSHALQSMVTSLLARANLSAIVCIQDAADPDDDLVHASSEFLNAVLLTSAAAVQMQVAILSVHPALSATNIDARMVAVNSIELHGDVQAVPETMGAQTP